MATAAPTTEAPKAVAVTYSAKAGDPVFTMWHGLRFEHNRPVQVPADHAILKRDPKTGLAPVDTNDWFSHPDKRAGKPSSGEIDSPAAYFAHASTWIAQATTSGALKTRWDREAEMRERVGWGADDEDRIDDIRRPKLEALRKAERSA